MCVILPVGLITPVASLAILCVMSGALYMHVVLSGDPFVSAGGASWELAAVYWSLAVALAALGPGSFSADRAIFGYSAPGKLAHPHGPSPVRMDDMD